MSVPLPWRNVPGQLIPKMIQVKFLSQQHTPIKSWQHLGRNLVKWTPTTQEVSVLLVARVWLFLSRWSWQLHRTSAGEESNATHDDPLVDPEIIIREEGWLNHKMDEGNFDPKLVAVAGQEEFKNLEVHEIVKEEEFKRDEEADNIGTKWVVTNKGAKSKTMIKARLVGKGFADDTKKLELFAGKPGLSRVAVLSVQACNQEVR